MNGPVPSRILAISIVPLVLTGWLAVGDLTAPPTADPAAAHYGDSPAPPVTPTGTPLEPDGDPLPTPVTMVDAALLALSEHVVDTSHPDALRTAIQAYLNYREHHSELVRKPYFFYVDLGLDNRTARGFVFDMESFSLVEGPFMVSHGSGSSPSRDGVPTSFSNQPGSNASSLGLYLAEETYAFSGRSGGTAYRSVGLRMRGESGEFNGAARQRGIVSHGAPYVTSEGAGRSEGCPAMEQDRADRLLPMIANGGVVFLYSPNDPRWLHGDPWL